LANGRYELEAVIPGKKPKMTEEMRARIEDEKPRATSNIMLPVVDQGKRYPMRVQVKAYANWDDLIRA
jgi:hypothetical protein